MTMAELALFYLVLPALTLLWGLRAWLKYGRDPAGKGLVIPQYESPDDLSPAEIGVLYDYESADREITATIMDLTIRGYIKVHQVEEDRLVGKGFTYAFELLRDDVLDLKEHEQKLLDGLFGVYSAKKVAHIQSHVTNPRAREEISSQYQAGKVSLIGKTVSLKEIKPYFYKRVFDVHESLFSSLTTTGHFTHNPLYNPVTLPVVAFCLISAAIVIRGPRGTALCLSALPLIVFAILMKARSPKGQLIKEYIDGFRDYLQTAEKDRISSLQGPHSSEVKNFSELHLYEHFLPYAVALGLENEWTKKFAGVYGEPPNWLDLGSGTSKNTSITDISNELIGVLNSHKPATTDSTWSIRPPEP